MGIRSKIQYAWYVTCRGLLRVAAKVLFRVECHDRALEPAEGGVLVLSNHQSNLDPILIGTTFRRPMSYLARKSLFRLAPVGWLFGSLGAIPIDRDQPGISQLKGIMRLLKRGEMVLLFPEGTRSEDGEVGTFKSGFCALARRGNVSLQPVAVDGAFEAWPRTHRLPRPGKIHVQLGTPISSEEIAQLSDQELTALVEERIRSCHAEARRKRLDGQR